MRSIRSLSTTLRRHTWVGSVVGVLLLAGSLAAVQAWARSSGQEGQPPPGRLFSSDAGMMFNVIKSDKTADFEAVMAKVKEALQKSQVEGRKGQAASWKVFKSVEPGPGGNVLYVFIMDPAAKGVDYTVSKILAEVFPTEVQDLYKKYSDSYASGQSLVNLQLIEDFGK